MNEIFFTSDTHFYHRNIVEFCRATRQGADANEMSEIIIERWNDRVRPEDHVYHLGDFSFGKAAQTEAVLQRLNGRIHLVKGNHDRVLESTTMRGYFESFQVYKTAKIGDIHVIMFHFPIEDWDRKHYGSWHLHGHTHGGNSSHHVRAGVVNRLDIGVDTRTDMAPYSWEEVRAAMAEHNGRIENA